MQNTISMLPSELSPTALHGHLLGAVGPRPIAFASTLDGSGRPNLAPFSFFNIFSSRPPVLLFSPARRVRDKSTKHTLDNVRKTGEVVINIVSYSMVQQTSLASTEYAEGENEFLKSGFTMQPSDLVKPFRVAESPVQFECRVTKVEPLGKDGGAGNLVFSEILKMHIRKEVLDENGQIDPRKIDQVARLGANWYTRASAGLFEVPKPLSSLGIGVDRIPESIRNSSLLTGNDLGKLGNVEQLPSSEEVHAFLETENGIVAGLAQGETRRFELAQEYLSNNDALSAWKVLLAKT